MQQSLTIMTESEGRLHEIAKRMAFALPASRMRDYERPLTIVLTGGFDVGKSIFADVIRQNLMDMATCLREDPAPRSIWRWTWRTTAWIRSAPPRSPIT